MTHHLPHGSLPPPSAYRMRCDFPGCGELSPEPTHIQQGTGFMDDLQNRQRARVVAEANGWYVTVDRGGERSRDLCPGHARGV
jgi:DNA-binding transcriptional regulator LsrR (DeoR family)